MKRHTLSYAIAIILLIMLGLVAQQTADKSVLYPPLAALILGVLLKDTMPWRVRLWQITPILTAAAFIGVIIANYLKNSTIISFSIGYFLIAVVLTIFRSTLFPALATALLPIVLHITSPHYVLSVFVCSLTVSLIGRYYIAKGWNNYQPEKARNKESLYRAAWHWTYLWLYFVVLLIVAVLTHKMTLIAPPLIVIYITLNQNRTDVPINSYRILLAIFLSSCCGAIGKYALSFSLPLPVILPVTFLLAYFLMRRVKIIMPPVAAISILPFVLPGKTELYPLLATLGSIYLIICVNIRRAITRSMEATH